MGLNGHNTLFPSDHSAWNKRFYNKLMKYMAKWTPSLLLLLTILGMPFSAFARVTIGDPAPIITGKLMDGTVFTSKDWQGRVILIHFWASWCEPCKEELPLLKSFYEKNHPLGLEVITISMDKPVDTDLSKKMMQMFPFTNSLKNEVQIESFGRIWRIPTTFVINRQGIVVKDGLKGNPQIDEHLLNQVVRPLLENVKDTKN
jgi:thiol-disulfide isomerase/thioredoxin